MGFKNILFSEKDLGLGLHERDFTIFLLNKYNQYCASDPHVLKELYFPQVPDGVTLLAVGDDSSASSVALKLLLLCSSLVLSSTYDWV